MSSTNSSQMCPTMNRLRKSAISHVVVEKLILQPARRTHGEDVFFRGTAARKSGRCRIGALPDLFKVRYHCPWYLLSSSVERWYV